ncbi:MAG: YdcF family protein [Catenulispora sp.]|nr:YdcF family protein [Catenulispora sp.]
MLTALVRVLLLLFCGGALVLLAVAGYGGLSRRRRPGAADFVVVLGSTLTADRRVPPLLAARLDRARDVAERLRERGGAPLLIVSGGKTSRDPASEAGAMAAYLIDRGETEAGVLREDQSLTTKDNLRRTAELMRRRAGSGGHRCAIVSSDYHCLRVALLARQNALAATVVGARTPAREWPVALLRDCAALLVTWWKTTAVVAIALVVVGVLV